MKFDRQEAIATAMMTFWRQGASKVTVKAFCEELGITRSSFYNAFGSLEKLFDESVELYLEDAPANQLASADSAALDSIYAMFRLLCRFRAKDKEHKGCLVINSLAELGSLEEGMQQSVLNKVEETVSAFNETLQLALANGELAEDINIETTAMALQTLVVGINTMSKVVHKEKDLWAIAESTLRGLGIKPSSH